MSRTILTLTTLMTVLLVVTSLAAAEGTRYLIIHADDAGMCHSENAGTIDAMVNGFVSSSSIMVPCPAFEEIAAIARDQYPGRDWGIHLTLTSEWSSYGWGAVLPVAQVPSLVDPNTGRLWQTTEQVAAHAVAAEVDMELRAQIDRAIERGIRLTHLDTHMASAVCRPDLLELYVQLGIDYDLPVLFPGPGAYDDLNFLWDPNNPWWGDADFRAADLVQRLDDAGLPILDRLLQFYTGDPNRDQIYLDAITSLTELPPGSVSQLIIHCGYNDEELRSITASAPWRDFDRLFFQNPDVLAHINDCGIEITTWGQYGQSPVPEPSGTVLATMAIGLAALFGRRLALPGRTKG
jgi:chitin disaccharide deacetylase